jgi:hypothetical protein
VAADGALPDVIVTGGGPRRQRSLHRLCDARPAGPLLERAAFTGDHPGETLHPEIEPVLKHLA